MTIKSNDREQNIQVVTIEGFDQVNKTIDTVSKAGGRISIPMYLTNGMLRIPKIGENWIVRRFDTTNWFFEGRYSDTDYMPFSDGDGVIDAKYLYIVAEKLLLGGIPLGTAEIDEFDITNPDVKEIQISHIPIQKSLQVFNNGLLIAPSSIIIEKTNLVFENSLSVGKVVSFYQKEYAI